jgi:hypothetical protein
MKELEDTNSTLKADLQSARSTHTNEPKMKEKVAELEGCIDTLKQENSQLQVPTNGDQSLLVGFKFFCGGGGIYQVSNNIPCHH